MTIYHTYIDDNVGLSSSTIAGIQTNGSTYGVGISSNGYFSGIVTASSFVGDGSKLTGVTVTQVSTGTTTGITTYYPTFVDSNNSTRDNKFLYTNAGISYNPSTNLLSVNGIIESSNDYPSPNNEGGQFVLRGKSGTSSRWCIDNHTNAGNAIFNQFRIFREDDGTSLNGLAYVGITTIGEFIIGSGGALLSTGTPNQQLQVQSGAYISGNLGIGTTNPTSKLHVSGNVTVTGSVSKGSGSFVIDHPLNETKNLVHSFVEGPRADLIYRGTVSLIDGSATINLDEEYELIPGTWKALCRNPQVWISNIDGWTKCRGTVEDGILIIEAQTASNESVNWLVIAERKDKHMYDTGWTDDNGRPILEPVKL